MAEEQENLNDFKRWDAVGAAAMLSFTPVVMCYVFTDHDKIACLPFAAIAAAATVGVLVLTLIFSETFVGRIVNLVGNILAPTYLVVAICLFYNKWTSDDSPMALPGQNTTQEASGGAASPQP